MLGINSHALPVQTVQHMVLSISARAKKVAQSTRRTQRLTHVYREDFAQQYGKCGPCSGLAQLV